MALIKKYKFFNEFDMWVYTPDVIHAFPFRMEPITFSWRIRCFLECFVGYKVFYAKDRTNDSWIGYCVISDGRNPRYKFASKKDIIFGRYFIADSYRGRGLSKILLKRVLDDCDLNYEKAFAYVHDDNLISQKAISSIGGKEIARFNLVGLLRKVKIDDQGAFVLYEYLPRKELQP